MQRLSFLFLVFSLLLPSAAHANRAEQPIAHLAGFAGVLQVDGYAGYRALAEKHAVQLAFCWCSVIAEASSSHLGVSQSY